MWTFVESSVFSRFLKNYLSEEEYIALQWHIAANPEEGYIIRGSGGIRKLRWGSKGKGKRGGVRVIYYVAALKEELWLLTIYANNEEETLPTALLQKIKEAMQRGYIMKKQRNIAAEMLEAVEEIKSGGGKRSMLKLPQDIVKVREDLHLSQTGLAAMLGVSVRTLQAWEQGRRNPSGAALALFKVAAFNPKLVKQSLSPTAL